MLPEIVWDMPPLGTFNLHASLLPQYRGAAPINWAIINGEKETGVTTFFLTHEIDTGNIILQKKTPISSADTAGSIHDKLMTMGAELVKETVELIIEDKAEGKPQPHVEQLKLAPKIFKDTCQIDWDKPTEELHNFVRGLSPYPAAWTELISSENEMIGLKIFETEMDVTPHKNAAGQLFSDGKNYLKVSTKNGYLKLLSIQLAGKKRMSVEEFLRGFKVNDYHLAGY
jgi:methionyl-tRNA formyltransferase